MNNKDTKSNEEPKSIITNNYSTVYSLTNAGGQDQESFVTNTTALNVYNTLSYGINGELLVRNKSKNGNFTDNLQVDGGDVIEFKLSITNTSSTITLYTIKSDIQISNNLLSNLYIPPTATMGTVMASPTSINFSISKLSPRTTAIATYEVATVGSGNLRIFGDISVKEESISQLRKFNFSTLPSISITNAPNLGSTSMIPFMIKYQKLIQPGSINNFVQTPINVINGDIIEFELHIGNISSNYPNLYNLNIVDKLSNKLSYIEGSFKGSYEVSGSSNGQYNTIWGNANFNSTNATNVNGKLVGGSIEWTMSILHSPNINVSSDASLASLYFQCEVVE